MEDQKLKSITLKRAISEHDKLISSQNNLNLSSDAFFTANAVVDSTTGASLEYPQLKLGKEAKAWIKGCSNEIGRLARGIYPQMIIESNTIHFIYPSQKPSDRVATYLHIVSSFRPQKEDPFLR